MQRAGWNPESNKNIADSVKRLVSAKGYVDSHGTGQTYQIRTIDPIRVIDTEIFDNVVGIKVFGYHDIIKNDPYPNLAGSSLLDNLEFAGSGTEDRFETVPLVQDVIFKRSSTRRG